MSVNLIRIRRAGMGDLPELARLVRRSARELTAPFYSPAEIEAALAHFTIDPHLITDGTYAVALMGGEIAGCGGWTFRDDPLGRPAAPGQAAGLLDPGTDPALIRAVFVDPRFARRGIGSRLVEHAEAAGRRAGFRRFELSATLNGVALYLSLGYRPERQIAVALSDGVAFRCVHMSKQVDRRTATPQAAAA